MSALTTTKHKDCYSNIAQLHRAIKKIWDKRKKMIQITLSPATQMSFSNFTIKSKWNIEYTTDHLIITNITIIIKEVLFTSKHFSRGPLKNFTNFARRHLWGCFFNKTSEKHNRRCVPVNLCSCSLFGVNLS